MRYLILILLLSACQSSDTIDGSSQELFEASLHRILDDLEMTEQLYLTYCMTALPYICLLYTSPSPRDKRQTRMPSSA